MSSSTQKSFMPNSKEVRYVNRDFSQLREGLIDFAKYYYPNTYKDFNSAAPGMMFIEMAAYVGDVLSFYTDYIFKEGLLYNTQERKNISDGDDADINADEVKLYKKAIEMAKSDFTKAIELLNNAIEVNPRYSEAFIRRAEFYMKQFKFDDALEDLDEAIRINRNAYEAYALNGFILAYKIENKEKGLNDINRAIRINKEFAPAYLYRAFITVQNQNVKEVFESAKADLDIALKINPKYCEAYYFRGCIHHFNEQYDKAIEDLTKAFELKSLSKNFVLKHYEVASDEYEEVTAANMLDFRAYTYFKWGKWTQAIADYNQEEMF